MFKKRGIAPSVLIGIIAMVVIFIILFRLDIMIAKIIQGGAESQACFWSASLSSFSKVGPKTVMDLQCDRKTVYVMMNPADIPFAERDEDVEYVYIYKQIARKYREKLAKWYGTNNSDDFDKDKNKQNVLKYRLNEIMAKELKACWGNLGSGTYNLFDEDFTSLEHVGVKEAEGFFGTLIAFPQFWRVEFNPVPKVCKICSTIIFSDKVKNEFNSVDTNLKEFLQKNPVNLATPEAISYYEFLKDDIPQQSDFMRPNYPFTTDKTQAVIFIRTRLKSYAGGKITALFHEISELLSDKDYIDNDGEIIPLALDHPLIMPFDEVSNACDKFD